MDLGLPTEQLLLLLAALVGGFLLSRILSNRSTARQYRPELTQEDVLELRRNIRRLEHENNDLSLFFVGFPDLISQLISNKEKRNVAPILISLVETIFEPEQICVFYRGSDGERLKLAAERGLPPSGKRTHTHLSFTEGRVGWVATNQVIMDARDFSSASSFSHPAMESGSLKTDLCAALVDTEDGTTIGVLTVGGVTRFPRNEKKLIKMVAELGAMSIKNAEHHQHIQGLANRDGLTLLHNKRFGSEKLSMSIHRAEQKRHSVSVFLFDIDHFKNYNDTNGHLAGDELLRTLGKLVKKAIRADDYAIRFGGEEFLIVFEGTGKEGAAIAAEKIRRMIEGFPFPHAEKQPMKKVTVSGGIASFPADSNSSMELVRLADETLYQAKNGGRNRVEIYRDRGLRATSDPTPPEAPRV